MIEALHQLSPFDPEHLPEEILLTEAFHRRFPRTCRNIACFDTAFHHDLPRVARLLPIPRRYDAKGVRRYGFHGLSCAFLMEELARVAGAEAAKGRVILAHLGNGASMAAVRDGKPVDTSMSYTPTAGLVMSTRSGDLDPALAWYLSREEKVTAAQFHHMVNHESGLLGVSETSSDMRELLARERPRTSAPPRPWRCFVTRRRNRFARWLALWKDWTRWCSRAASARTPTRCANASAPGWSFIGIKMDAPKNAAGAAIISADGSASAFGSSARTRNRSSPKRFAANSWVLLK